MRILKRAKMTKHFRAVKWCEICNSKLMVEYDDIYFLGEGWVSKVYAYKCPVCNSENLLNDIDAIKYTLAKSSKGATNILS